MPLRNLGGLEPECSLEMVWRMTEVLDSSLVWVRSGPAKLNSAISGKSWYKAGSKAVWQKGVSDGKEESIGSAHPPYPQSDVQGSGGFGRLAGRQDLG